MRSQSKGMAGDGYSKCPEASPLVATIVISTLLPSVVALPAATADAAGYLPNCGNSCYGGSIAPRYEDSGCTGNREIIRARSSRWGRRAATGDSSTAVNERPRLCSGERFKFIRPERAPTASAAARHAAARGGASVPD
jgi:hypothetical protein